MATSNRTMASFLKLLFLLATLRLGQSHSKSETAEAPLEQLEIEKTIGQVWPLPQQIRTEETLLQLDPTAFVFSGDGDCPIVQSAFYRYYETIFNPPRAQFRNKRPKWDKARRFLKKLQGQLPSLEVTLTGDCETWPSLNMDEQYQLTIGSDEYPLGAKLVAVSPWGALRGLETFSQLVYYDKGSALYLVNSTYIIDFPRFSHRGILVDTSRHYVPKHVILENLDAMAYNKMNVLHWHIVDDQSFPYQSRQFPDMSDKGAYDPETHIYTFDDITEVIEYARHRGIRVVPEFDTPGHTLSWGPGVPNLLTQCYDSDNKTSGYGPINPVPNSTYTFLEQFFAEAVGVFHDPYIHLGGDEVSFDCWQSNPDVQSFMKTMNYTSYSQLEGYYITNLLDIAGGLNASYLVWQEVVDNGVAVKNDTIVEVWKDGEMSELSNVTKMGLRAILASCWYLDYISYGSDWKGYYACEPLAFNGTAQQYELVVGGEACLWGEYVDASNLIARMWPRASAPAERLWSSRNTTDVSAAAPRLEEHRCRMLTRGVNAEPQNDPGGVKWSSCLLCITLVHNDTFKLSNKKSLSVPLSPPFLVPTIGLHATTSGVLHQPC